MKITAEQKYIRISPRKLRLVVDGLRGMHPEAAMTELGYMTRNAAEPVRKVIRQALANAVNNLNLNPGSLRISEILVDEGATYKRWQAVSRGRAHSILKRTSSVKVILESVGSVVPTSQPQPAKVTETTTKTEKTKDIKKPGKILRQFFWINTHVIDNWGRGHMMCVTTQQTKAFPADYPIFFSKFRCVK